MNSKTTYINKYKKENTKQKVVVFYKKDIDLYEYTKKINFGKWVKDKLREEYKKQIYQKDNYTLVVKDIDLYIKKEKIAFFLQDGELLFTTVIEKEMKPDKLFVEFIDGMKYCNFFGIPEEVRTD